MSDYADEIAEAWNGLAGTRPSRETAKLAALIRSKVLVLGTPAWAVYTPEVTERLMVVRLTEPNPDDPLNKGYVVRRVLVLPGGRRAWLRTGDA